MKKISLFGLCAVLALFVSGCVSKSVLMKETQRADQLTAQIKTLEEQIKAMETSAAALKGDNAELMKSLDAKKGELNQRVAELSKANQELVQQLRETQQAKEAEIAQLKGSYDQLVNGLKTELEAGQLTITQLKGRLTLTMTDKILFNSGEADVKQEGRKILDKVAGVLKTIQDKDIRIEGYTDNVPISSSLQSRYPTNWELSTARATAVVRYLQEKGSFPGDRLIAAGYGENHPVAPNTSPEGKQQNRRIEIVLVPRDTGRQ
jgi:chemotaxis protein MotB